MNGFLPSDFTSLTEAVVIIIPRDTLATADYRIDVIGGAAGESWLEHSANDSATTYNVTSGTLFEIDVSEQMTALTANDYFGVKIQQSQANHKLDIVGLRLKYV